MTIKGKVNAAATQSLATKRSSKLGFSHFGTTGWMVSEVGFGLYRIDEKHLEGKITLSKAIDRGVNIFDTSANYGNGESEQVLGEVLKEKALSDDLNRESLIIVSKGGYIQGKTLKHLEENKYPEVSFFNKHLAHCIHPNFLKNQITMSLNRMGLETIDVYLLHNPEYFLQLEANKMHFGEALLDEYYHRIELAFAYLEEEVEKGRIQYYGISSNTFVSSDNTLDHTDISRISDGAKKRGFKHFKVVQFPMNILETGAYTSKNPSCLRVCQEASLAVMVNRPLNAMHHDIMVRLIDVDLDDCVPEPDQIEEVITHCMRIQKAFDELEWEENHVKAWKMIFSFVDSLGNSWSTIQSFWRWESILSGYIIPRVEACIYQVSEDLLMEHQRWVELYLESFNALMRSITGFYKDSYVNMIKNINAYFATSKDLDCPKTSQLAIRVLRKTKGIHTILVGMRERSYLEDVMNECRCLVDKNWEEEVWFQIQQRFV